MTDYPPELVALMEDVARKAIQSEMSKWATKTYFPDLRFEPGQVAMFNATHHRLMPSDTAGGGGHIFQDNGTSLTDRTYADFQDGFVLADDSAGDATEIDLDYATTEIADIAEVEAAGTSSKVPRADHVHSGQAYVLEASANYVDLTDGGATTLHSHSGGAGTLDNAYDFGGAGSGRTINTTDGAVLLQTTEADVAPNLDLRRAVGDVAKAAIQVGVNSEANPRLEIEAGGTINLGQGGASVVDVEIGSPSAQVVQIQVPGGAAATLKVANIAEQITNGRVAMTDGITVNQVLGLTQDAATLTVGGQLTATHPWMVVTSNSGTADDMDNLATTGIATADGDKYYISAASGHTITIRDNGVSGGNISTMTGSAITLDSVEKVAVLMRDGTTYYAGTLFSSAAGSVATDTIWDAAGDLAVGTGADTAARLAIGTARFHLGVNAAANALEWVASPQSLMTATGDILIASAANTPAKLASGAAGTYLAGQGAGVAPAYATPQSFRIHKLRPNAAPGAAISVGNGQDFSWTGNNLETVVKIMWICQTVGTALTFGIRFQSGVEDYDSVTLPLGTTVDTEAIGTATGGTDTTFTDGTIDANSIISLDIDSLTGTYKDLWVFMLTKLGLTT